jgi:hypothetical protein
MIQIYGITYSTPWKDLDDFATIERIYSAPLYLFIIPDFSTQEGIYRTLNTVRNALEEGVYEISI